AQDRMCSTIWQRQTPFVRGEISGEFSRITGYSGLPGTGTESTRRSMKPHEAQQNLTTWLWWSSGKDSAWALRVLRAQGSLEVSGLVTTCNQRHDRVAMHGVRRELLRRQACALGLPLHEMSIPDGCDNETYQQAFKNTLDCAREAGVQVM